MSWTRGLLEAAVLGVVLVALGASAWAQDDPGVTERKATAGKMKTHSVGTAKSTGTVSIDTGDSRTTDDSQPAKTKKKTKKKKTTKKKAKADEPKVRRYGVGLKFGLLPYNTMSALRTDASGRTEYDMAFGWGWGATGQYRLLRNFYLTGEIMYWYTRVQGKPSNYPDKGGEEYKIREDDGLLNMGVGLRFNVYGGEKSRDRVFLLGKVGFTDYIADDANPDGTNRAGIYGGGGAGYEHSFADLLSVFADTGVYYNGFMSTGASESEASMWYWAATAGFLFHFDKN